MDWKKTINKTIEYVFYGIAVVQMVMGFIWLWCQFPHMQNWQETYEYLDISKTWVLDEYVGFVYPLLLKMCTGIESFVGIPFYMPVYVIQLTAAIFASWFFVRKVLTMEKRKAVWAVGYLISFPLLLQFHMSVRPESLSVSGLLMLIAVLKNEKLEDKVLSWVRSVIYALVLTVFLMCLKPDLVVLCVVVWVMNLLGQVYKIWKEKKSTGDFIVKGIAIQCGVFLLTIILGLSVNGLTQTPGSRGRIQKTFWAAMFQRVVTDYFSRSYAMWDGEVRTTFTIEEAMEMAKRSDNMMYVVGPMLEADWGKERANQMYRQMTIDCFRVRTRDIVYQIRDDLVDSALMPFSIWWQSNGERQSQTGWNYERFRAESPELSKLYMKFAVLALAVCEVLAVITQLIKKRAFKNTLVLMVLAATQCLYIVLGTGNTVNYSQLLLVILFWSIIGVGVLFEEA